MPVTASPAPMRAALTVEQLWQPVPGGSGTYIRALAAALLETRAVEVTGIAAHGPHADAASLLPSVPVVASALPRRALYESWSRLRSPSVPRTPEMRRTGARYDVVHATTWAVPPRTAPLVVTVHDLAFERNPEHFTPRGVSFFRRALEVTRREADIVVVPSEATRTDCVDAGLDPDRLRVIPHGTAPVVLDPGGAEQFRRRHGLRREFVLWCGTLEPRKNLGGLLEAFARLLEGGSDLDLVIVGPTGWGSTTAQVREHAERLAVDRVHVLGRLDDDELQEAYAAARVFCFPSLWEGFGMPVLEAMNHGTPVVTSAGTSMAEVAGDGALLVDPTDAAELAGALARAAGPSHEVLSHGARAAAARWTWQRSAGLHLEAYREAVEIAPGRRLRRTRPGRPG